VAGVNDGSFEAFPSKTNRFGKFTAICITVMRGHNIISVKIDRVSIDGIDVTETLLNNLDVNGTKVVILGGITFAGFNIVDTELLYTKTGIPIIVFSKSRPNSTAIKKALMKHFDDWKLRWSYIEKIGEVYTATIYGVNPIFYETIGCSPEWAKEVLVEQCINSRVPESVRIAKMIARGVSPFFLSQGR
jgi:endonuclease V-like protein UPF0215 family